MEAEIYSKTRLENMTKKLAKMAPAGVTLDSLLAPLARPWTHLGRPLAPLGIQILTFWLSVRLFNPKTPKITQNEPKIPPK